MQTAQAQKNDGGLNTRGARVVACVLVGIVGLGVVIEGLGVAASAREAWAMAALNGGRPADAERGAVGALALSPWHAEGAFTRVMALRTLEKPELAETAERYAVWHPQRNLVLLIAGEARLARGENQAAMDDLWAGLWSAPIQPHSATIFWSDAWVATRKVKGDGDARTQLARRMMEKLMVTDKELTAEQVGMMRGELAGK